MAVQSDTGRPEDACDDIHCYMAGQEHWHGAWQHFDVQPSGWQPIETAPTDGTLVLLWPVENMGKPFMTVGRRWNSHPDIFEDAVSGWGFTPTHWMPLPEAPE